MVKKGGLIRLDALSRPTTLLATCRASYFVSAFEYYADTSSRDDLLYYLPQCHLVYEQPRVTLSDNPWLYQPAKIYTQGNFRLLDEKSFKEFAAFLNKFNIEIRKEDIQEKKEIIEVIKKNLSRNNVLVIDIDEFYNPANPEYFMKETNPHALLVKGINFHKKHLEVIDTEYSDSYRLTFGDIKKAFTGVYYVIRCREFSSKIDYAEAYINFSNNNNIADVVSRLRDDLKDLVSGRDQQPRDAGSETTFLLKGLNFCFTYQILPMIKMRSNLFFSYFLKTHGPEVTVVNKAKEMLDDWRRFLLILTRTIHDVDQPLDRLTDYLDHLVDRENDLNEDTP